MSVSQANMFFSLNILQCKSRSDNEKEENEDDKENIKINNHMMMNENDEDNDDNTLKTAQVQSLVCPIGLRDFSQRLGQIQQPLPFLPVEFGYKTPHLHGTGISTIQHSPNTNLTSEPATPHEPTQPPKESTPQ